MTEKSEPPGLGQLLLRAFRWFEGALFAELRAEGWTDVRPAHSQVFAHLQRGGSRASDLARRAGVSRQAMSELVRELESLGYLEQVPDPANRSARIVRLTPRGVAHVRDARRIVARLEEELTPLLGDRAIAALQELADREPPTPRRASAARPSADRVGGPPPA